MFMDLGTAAGVAAALALDAAKAAASAPVGACLATPLQDTNVSAVQAVLVGVYNQRVHGPISSLPGEGVDEGGDPAPRRCT
jgi:hypothetical protein